MAKFLTMSNRDNGTKRQNEIRQMAVIGHYLGKL